MPQTKPRNIRWRAPLYGVDGLTLGERLRRLRRASGKTAKQVAFSIEESDSQLSRWENDQSIPLLPSFASLAEHYGVPMERLYWGETQPTHCATCGQRVMSDFTTTCFGCTQRAERQGGKGE